jgi:hypothetical protein
MGWYDKGRGNRAEPPRPVFGCDLCRSADVVRPLYGRTLVGVYLIGSGPIRQPGRPMFFVRRAVPDPARPEGATMSVATLSDTLPGVPVGPPKVRWFKGLDHEDDPNNPEDGDNWPKRVQRVWKILLRLHRTTGRKVFTIPVWKLAELCGRCQRTVWSALRWLVEHGIIRRYWISGRKEVENRKGHHGEVGRATEIMVELGYGNDSRRTGPLPSRFLHNDAAGRFAFSVETRPQRLRRRGITDPLISPARPAFSAFAGAFQARGPVSREANRVRGCRLIANPTPVISRGGETGLGSVSARRRERNRCLTKPCRVER